MSPKPLRLFFDSNLFREGTGFQTALRSLQALVEYSMNSYYFADTSKVFYSGHSRYACIYIFFAIEGVKIQFGSVFYLLGLILNKPTRIGLFQPIRVGLFKKLPSFRFFFGFLDHV